LRQISGERKILDIIQGNACGQEIKPTITTSKLYKKNLMITFKLMEANNLETTCNFVVKGLKRAEYFQHTLYMVTPS
jgi:hypothetical protein